MNLLGDAGINKQTQNEPENHPFCFSGFAQLGSHVVEFVVPLLGKGQALCLPLKEELPRWGHPPQLCVQGSSTKDLF